MTKTRLLYIVNPISGTNRKRDFAAIADAYTDKNRFDFQTVYTERAGHASELARQAAAEGIDIVAAVGGDGTVNEIAASLVQTPTALAIVPSGSGNGLARHLQLPMDMPRAIEVINKAEIHALDYGTLNGHPFFCTCVASRRVWPQGQHTLDIIAARCGYDLTRHHHALADAEACAAIALKIL